MKIAMRVAMRPNPAVTTFGAEDGTRTRDPHLGKVMLYQLSHFRVDVDYTKSASQTSSR